VSKPVLAALAALLAAGCAVGVARSNAPEPDTNDTITDPQWLQTELGRVREKRNLPAVAACVVIGDRVVAASAVGVRKQGEETPVTRDDRFHIGSIAKPMTATLTGILADRKLIQFDTTLEKMFPEIQPDMRTEYRKVTLSQLLGHVSGMPYQPRTSERDTDARGKTLADKRYEYVKAALADEPAAAAGKQFIYGGGSIIVASYLERTTRQPFEELMSEHLFKRLGMRSAAFGSTATAPDQVDGPWEHDVVEGKPKAIPPDPAQAAQTRSPAGRNVVCTVADLGRFASATLLASQKKGQLLTLETAAAILTPVPPGHHTPAWGYAERVDWARGPVFWHSGSNLRNFALVHIVPGENYAICVMTNVGGKNAETACNELNLLLAARIRKEGITGFQ
jgi:CubicO group peptidase (beta-lactamase class C family)